MKTKQVINCMLFVAATFALFTSCDDAPEVLTKSEVKSEVKRVLGPELDNIKSSTLELGYYELNSEAARFTLRKLAAAGVINYNKQTIIEFKKSYWRSWEEKHVFVTVSLTEEGKKYVIPEEKLEKIKKEKEEHKAKLNDTKVVDTSVFPEAKVSEEEVSSVSSNDNSSTSAKDNNKKSEPAEKSDYEKALEKVNVKTVTVETYKMELEKVQNIKCTPAMLEEGTAKAEVILECTKSTPFGRILSHVYEGEREIEKCSFELFTDGWKVVFK